MKRLLKVTACTVGLAVACSCAAPVWAAQATQVAKDENVFVFLNPDGSISEQIVSDWLHSETGFHGVKDTSTLGDISVLKGDATLNQDGEKLVWDTPATDIYYQGNTAKTPPITAAITYQLDGKEVPAEALAGQDGHLVINIKLTNHETQQQTFGGKERTVCTPFATLVTADLPVDVFYNVKAEHGTVQTDSANQLVCFLAMPGMRDSLRGLLTSDLTKLNDMLLDEVTIEADVKQFAMPTILLAAATSVDELSDLPDVSGVSDKLDELSDGTKTLKEGATLLDSKMAELQSGYNTFDAGVDSALSGAQQVKSGADQLLTGTQSLNAGVASLQAGSNKLAGSLNEQLVPQLMGAATLQKTLQTDMASLNTKLAALQTGSVTLPDSAVQQVSAAVSPAVSNAFGTVAGVAANSASQATATQIITALAAQSQQLQTQIDTYTQQAADATATGDADAAALVQQATIAKTTLDNAIASIQTGLQSPDSAAAVTGSQQVADAGANIGNTVVTAVQAAAPSVVQGVVGGLQGDLDKVNTESTSLMTGMSALMGALYQKDDPNNTETVVGAANALATGASQVAHGAAALQDGVSKLSGGANSLSDGLSKLSTSSKTIKSSLTQFKSGTLELANGTLTLADGVGQMTSNSLVQNLPTIDNVMAQMRQQAEDYTSYTGSVQGQKASVKFIMKVQAPTKDETSATVTTKQETEQPEKVTFWQRLKDLF
ncbi:MAG: putative rane protein [Clostridiales bacterium]|nr:putative rane protein [Clostridiales bacterium]